jgi:uncharacterized protein
MKMAKTIFLLTFVVSATCVLGQRAIPELWGLRVHDEAKVLSQSTIDALEAELKKYEDSTSNQIAILIIPSLNGDILEDYSIRVVERWKLGTKKNDNGVLILIARDDHAMRIEVGEGLEGVLTDAMTNRIIRNEMAPAFRRGDFDAGVSSAVASVIKAIGGEYTEAGSSAGASGNSGDLSLSDRIIAGLFVLGILSIFTMIALFSQGCAGWGLYAFLIPFYATFPLFIIGTTFGIGLLIFYVVAMPIAKVLFSRSSWGKDLLKKWQSNSGRKSGGWSMGSGWGSSGGWSSGGSSFLGGGGSGFSGGGGSFGGGGSSGSW